MINMDVIIMDKIKIKMNKVVLDTDYILANFDPQQSFAISARVQLEKYKDIKTTQIPISNNHS